MKTAKKLSREEMIAKVEAPDYNVFDHVEFERVRGTENGKGSSPVSLRLSEPLLEHLDRMAKLEHRSRSNLIQHILWTYIRDKAK